MRKRSLNFGKTIPAKHCDRSKRKNNSPAPALPSKRENRKYLSEKNPLQMGTFESSYYPISVSDCTAQPN